MQANVRCTEVEAKVQRLEDAVEAARQQNNSSSHAGEMAKSLSALRQELEAAHAAELEARGAQHNKAMADLGRRADASRQRAIALLDEKDREIAALTARTASPTPGEGGGAHQAPAGGPLRLERLSSGSKLVHNVLAERDGTRALADMAAQIRALELKLGEATVVQSAAEDRAARLQDEVRRHERNSRREGANLEYLKNIMVKFMVGQVGREQTLRAIGMILEFSEEELASVKRADNGGWWPRVG